MRSILILIAALATNAAYAQSVTELRDRLAMVLRVEQVTCSPMLAVRQVAEDRYEVFCVAADGTSQPHYLVNLVSRTVVRLN